MKQNNQAEFYFLVTAYRAAYTGSDKTEANKAADAIWTQLKDDTSWACFVLFFF